MLKPLLTVCAIGLAAAAAPSAADPMRTGERSAADAAPQLAVVANGKTAEKKPRPKASKRPRKASRADAPAAPASGSK
jgi:hypothetical protein